MKNKFFREKKMEDVQDVPVVPENPAEELVDVAEESGSGSSSGSSSSGSSSSGSSSDSSGSSDDSSESSDEEEEEVPKRKQPATREVSKKKRFKFLDVEADVGSGDDEDEEFIDDEAAARAEGSGRESRELELLRREAETRRKNGGNRMQSVIQRLEERAAKEKAGELDTTAIVPEVEEEDVDYENAAQASSALFPTSDDYKLFFVRMAEPGKEKESVIQLSHKAAEEIAAGKDCRIRSVFSVDSLRGYIYIEAPNDSVAKNFLQGIRKVQWYNVVVVPFNEMVGVFRTALDASNAKFRPLVENEFVRIKRNALYKGDLARVIQTYDADVEVAIVPRLDLTAAPAVKGSKKSLKARPALFDAKTVSAMGFDVERLRNPSTGLVRNSFRGELFTDDGFLIKRVSRSSLAVGPDLVVPTLAELRMHTLHRDEIVVAKKAVITSFAAGDTVIIKSGDTKNLIGTVALVDKQGILTIESKSLDAPIQVLARDVDKYFSVSDHVLVLAGPSAGDTGIVTSTDAQRMHTVLIDGETREISISAMSLQNSAEVSKGESSLGGYALGDLVLIKKPVEAVGIIIKISKSGNFSILVIGRKYSVNISDIVGKKDGRQAFALSKHGDAVRKGSVVSLLRSSASGTVAEVYRNAVFVKVANRTEDGGFLVVDARELEVISTNERLGPNNAAPIAPAAPVQYGSNRRSKLEGKRVRIIKGPFKGQLAQVREDHDTRVQVSLEAKFRVVTIPKEFVRLEDEEFEETNVGTDNLNQPPMGSLDQPPAGYVPPSSTPFTPAPPHLSQPW